MAFPPLHLAHEPLGGIGNVCLMMGEMSVHNESYQRRALAPGQCARQAVGRGVCSDGVGEIGNDGHSKHSAVSVPLCSAHDPLTH